MESWCRSVASLAGLKFSEREIVLGTALASAFSVVTMPIEVVMLRKLPTAPLWPILCSAFVSAMIFGAVVSGITRGGTWLVRILFVVNVAAIVAALFILQPYFAINSPAIFP